MMLTEKEEPTCLDCKHSFIEDLDNCLACDLTNRLCECKSIWIDGKLDDNIYGCCDKFKKLKEEE